MYSVLPFCLWDNKHPQTLRQVNIDKTELVRPDDSMKSSFLCTGTYTKLFCESLVLKRCPLHQIHHKQECLLLCRFFSRQNNLQSCSCCQCHLRREKVFWGHFNFGGLPNSGSGSLHFLTRPFSLKPLVLRMAKVKKLWKEWIWISCL